MNREDCREPWATELSDHFQDACIVGCLADHPAKIRFMESPVFAWCDPDQLIELLHFCAIGPQFSWPILWVLRRDGRARPPPPHKAQKKTRRHRGISSRPVERKEAIPDDLRIDVPAGERRFRGLNQVRPGCAIDVGSVRNLDPACEDSFVLRISSRLLKKDFVPALWRKSFRFRPKKARNPGSRRRFWTDFPVSGACSRRVSTFSAAC
jgi:hypothetical protein